MKLRDLIADYVAFRQSMGYKFTSCNDRLQAFCRAVGSDIDARDVTPKRVLCFLGRPTNCYWHDKYSTLNVFYRYAISRGHVSSSPLPAIIPKVARDFVPYIYSESKVRRLLDATASYRKTHLLLEPYTFRAILLILYGAGLRISEALSLRIGDVDFSEDVLLIRETKFYKTRLLPIGSHLKQALMVYAAARCKAGHSESAESPFFVGRKGSPVTIHTVQQSFRQLRKKAGIHRSGGARNQPRLHDLRHAFAGNRVVAWYKAGSDVQRLLPKLSTYLGHVGLSSTQRYLTMTPALLQEAGRRFEQYAWEEASMNDTALIGPWIRRFLLEHLVGERNLSRNTQRSYRDTIALLMPFVSMKVRKSVDQICATDLSADRVRLFLADLEATRGCSIATRNQRLTAIHALARFVGLHSPEHIGWSGEIRSVPFKKTSTQPVPYLEKPEMDALLDAPDQRTAQGRRDHVLLLFLYNSGARSDEAAQLLVGDLQLATREQDYSSTRIRGKGNKVRHCPLWPQTVQLLKAITDGRSATERVFLNRLRQPMTRFGVHAMVQRHAARVSKKIPAMASKRVSPHSIRHTCATHLLRGGVDINTIRAWLGHVSLDTTNIYAEADLEMKAKALACCEVKGPKRTKHWRDTAGLMAFLKSL